jgi:hypothetical protein
MANARNPNPPKKSASTTTSRKPASSKAKTTDTTKAKDSASKTTKKTTKKASSPSTPEVTTSVATEDTTLTTTSNEDQKPELEAIALQLFAPYGGLKQKRNGQFAFEVLPGEEDQVFVNAKDAIAWLKDNREDLDSILQDEGVDVPTIDEDELNNLFAQALAVDPAIVLETTTQNVDIAEQPTADISEGSRAQDVIQLSPEEIVMHDQDENLEEELTLDAQTKAIALLKTPMNLLIFGAVNTETATGIYNHDFTQQELAEYLGMDPTSSLGQLRVAIARKGHALEMVNGKYKITA